MTRSRSSRAHPLATVVVFGATGLVACTDDAEGGCEQCRDPGSTMVCYESSECVPRCEVNDDCEQGHGCITYESTEVCDPRCQHELCPPRQECSADRCDPLLNCGFLNPCLDDAGEPDDTKVCDPYVDRCFPRNGDCSPAATDGLCPRFGEEHRQLMQIECDPVDAVCRANRIPTRLPWLGEDISDVGISDPSRGATFEDASEVAFSWEDTASAVLVRVLYAMPSSISEFEEHTIWGKSLAKGAPTNLDWADGYLIEDGTWQEGSPAPPAEGVYYVSVIAVELDEVIGASELVPFAVGSEQAWPSVGDECEETAIPGTCDHPDQPQACFQGRCHRLCASHLDCPGTDRCGDTIDGMRVCPVP